MLTSNNAYGKVRFAIEWLSSAADAYRQSYTLVSFICSRTNLSRSRVLDILKELKQGGYIEVDNGYFVRLCRTCRMVISVATEAAQSRSGKRGKAKTAEQAQVRGGHERFAA